MASSVAILTSVDNVLDARLHRISNALVKAGFDVEVRALGEAVNAPKGVRFIPAPGDRGFIGRLLRDLILPMATKADIWIVVAPDLLIPAWIFAKIRGRKIVADVHEDYLQLLKDRSWAQGLKGRVAQVVARISTRLAAASDITSVADTQVPPFNARKRIVLRNFPDLSLLTPSGELSPQPTAIYIGDVRKSRGLFTILESAEKSPGWEFHIIGKVADQDSDEVARWQESSAAAARVHFHGRLAPALAWKYAEGAWVGLTLLESTPAFVEAIPSKLYEYMSCGLATISTPLPRCIELIQTSKGGKIAKDSSEVAAILNDWQSHPDEIRAIRSAALSWAKANLDSEREYGAFVAGIRSLSQE